MHNGVHAKFAQNGLPVHFLLSTTELKIVEATRDRV